MYLNLHILYKGEIMRYYIYLDKLFLRSLFAVIDGLDFNIDVVEYAVKKSYTNNNGISIDPSFENGCSSDNFRDFEKTKSNLKKNKFSNERVRFGVDKDVTYNIQTERRYINISDITEMKNISFYHKLVLDIENMKNDRKEDRLYIDEGDILMYENRDDSKYSEYDGFFRINNTCVWYDRKNMNMEINTLSLMACKVKVVGYKISCGEKNGNIIKAIAIFIE